MNFDQVQAAFRDDRIRELSESSDGLRYLKLKSLSRLEYLKCLFTEASITPNASGVRKLFREAYETAALDLTKIDEVIEKIYKAEREQRRATEDELVSNLYRLNIFDWGGLYQNSLEKTIVDKYVKKISNYDTLNDRIENELHNSLKGYVLCSWYNHWTSIIIEDVFKDHASVLPAVGLVKRIDFFINDAPFDLKVTYLPEGYIKDARRSAKEKPELTLLKQVARTQEIHFDKSLPDGRLLTDLWAKHNDHPSEQSKKLISEMTAFRKNLIKESQADPAVLIRWLYENQGVRRFDASNRLFLVLIDESNFFESWKLKRAKPLLDKQVREYLDAAGDSVGRNITFQWKGSTFNAVSDVVFVVHKSSN